MPDEIWHAATKELDDRELADLLIGIARINVWNRIAVPTRTPPEPHDPPGGVGRALAESGDVWPQTREQRDWVHKVANVLDALPRSVQPTAKKMLVEIRDAEDRDHAVAAAQRFDVEFRPRWPKAADKITVDLDRLLTFFDFPAEHWQHLRTSNPIESTLATVRLRTNITKGPGSRAPAWPWRSSSSRPPRTAGGPSTDPTSSPSSEPAPSSTRG